MANPLTLVKLELDNYRCYSRLELDFHPRLTVLVAQNGGGKTSVLDAIAVAYGPFVGAFDEASGPHFEASDIRQNPVRQTASREMEFARGGTTLRATGFLPTADMSGLGGPETLEQVSWQRQLANPAKAKTTIKDCKALIAYGKYLQEEVRTPSRLVILPLVAYYGTGRLWQLKKLMPDDLARSSRTIGYTHCLNPGSSYKSFASWFRYWTESALNAKLEMLQAHEELGGTEFDDFIYSVNTAINICLESSGWGDLDYSIKHKELVANHPMHGQLPISLLSDGIRNMIGLVADIAFRATKLNPILSREAASMTPGLVLIDEIDMHLHPEWQQTVLTSLQRAFPEIQFIVTTHSPQVLTTVHSESIRMMRWDQHGQPQIDVPAHEIYGDESRAALEDVLQVPSRPPLPVNLRLQAYLQAIEADTPQTAALNAIRIELERELGAGHSQLQLADMLIARNAARHKKVRA